MGTWLCAPPCSYMPAYNSFGMTSTTTEPIERWSSSLISSYFEIILLRKVESLTFSNMKLPEHWKRDWKATFLYKFRILSMILVYHKIKVHWFVIWNHPMIQFMVLVFRFRTQNSKSHGTQCHIKSLFYLVVNKIYWQLLSIF